MNIEAHAHAHTPVHEDVEYREMNNYDRNNNNLDLIEKGPGQGFIFNPYNEHNIEIKEHDIKQILKKYGLPPMVHNIELYKRAFIHHSYLRFPAYKNEELKITLAECPPNCLPLRTKSNERLEFVGDGVLELITKFYLYKRFPRANEGFMTDKKIAIVKNESIGKICYEMGLQKWLIISRNAEEKRLRHDFKKLGCLFEAFLGALFLDYNKVNEQTMSTLEAGGDATGAGFKMAQTFVEHIFEQHIDWTDLITRADNYKNIFQEKMQKEFKLTPHYLEMPSGGDLENETYKMGVFLCLGQSIHNMDVQHAVKIEDIGNDINDLIKYTQNNSRVFVCFGVGEGKLKKKAEQAACKIALINLGFLHS